MSDDAPVRPPVTRRRWGMWALAFLTVAVVAVLTAGGGWTPLGALALVGGLAAAGYCTYRGIKEFTWLPR